VFAREGLELSKNICILSRRALEKFELVRLEVILVVFEMLFPYFQELSGVFDGAKYRLNLIRRFPQLYNKLDGLINDSDNFGDLKAWSNHGSFDS
jgi:hypothetical protein